MTQNSIRQITLNVLFLYIVIFSTATSTTLNRIGLVLLVCFGGLCLLNNGFKIKSNTFLNSMFLYGVFAFFAMFYSPAPLDKSGTVFLGYITMFIVVFVATLTVEDENDIKKLLNAFAVSSVVQCIYMLYVYGINIFSVIRESETGIRIGDEVSNSNSVGISFVLGAVISLSFLLNGKKRWYKNAFYCAVVLIGSVFGLLSGSRKAFVLLGIGFLMVLFLRDSGQKLTVKKIVRYVVAIIAVILIFSLISTTPLFATVNRRLTSLIDGLRGTSELDHSSETRFQMMEMGWEAFLESPVWGNGLYSSYDYFKTYSHNNFIEILMNTGILGFAIFYYPYFVFLGMFIKLKKRDGLYPIMLLILLWTFLGGVGLVNYYSKDSMTLMAIVSLWLSIKRREANDEKNTECNKAS